MTTALTIINSGLKNLGAIGVGEALVATDDEAIECLATLNHMLDTWRLESMMASYVVTKEYSMSSGASSFSIGPDGNIVVDRPIRIESLVWWEGNTSSRVDHTASQYDYAGWKNSGDTGTPSLAYFEPSPSVYDGSPPPTFSSDHADVHLWPAPANAGKVTVGIMSLLSAFTDLTTEIYLGPGYESAMAYNLPLFLSPGYEREVPQMTLNLAISTKAAIKSVNTRIPILRMPVGLPMHSVRSRILEGDQR